jgi:hypothetical protein
MLSPIEPGHIQRVVPVYSWAGSTPSHRDEGCWTLSKQGGEPRLIQQHFLVRRAPQRADLLFLAPGRKRSQLDTEREEALEALGFGVTAARLPAQHRSP